MDKLDKLDSILCGIGAAVILTGLSYIDNARTNRRLRKSAMAVENTSNFVRDTLKACTVPITRGGKNITAVAMTTPAIASQIKVMSE